MIRWLLVAFVLLAVGDQVAWGDLQIPEDQPRAIVFGGRESALEIRVTNEAAEAVASPVEYRVFQVANRVLAPLGERSPWKSVSLLAGQTAIERLSVQLPEVRAVSLFRVVFYAGEGELGRCSVVAVPQRLLAEFTAPIAVLGDARLAEVLKGLGMKVRSLEEVDETTIVLLEEGGTQDAGEVRQRAKNLGAKGVSTILLMHAREFARAEGGALQAVTGVVANRPGRLLIAKQLDFSQLTTSAEAQLGLHQLLNLARGADVFPWLE